MQKNGLDGANLKPWHLKATFTTFDAAEKPLETGTLEEWWAGPTKWKRSVSRGSYRQTLYAVAPGYAFIGSDTPLPRPADLMFNLAGSAMPQPEWLNGDSFVEEEFVLPRAEAALHCSGSTRNGAEGGSLGCRGSIVCRETCRFCASPQEEQATRQS